MGDFPDPQEAIRIAIAGCTFALMLGLAIVAGSWPAFTLAMAWIPFAWVMIPASEPGRTMAPMNPQHQDNHGTDT